MDKYTRQLLSITLVDTDPERTDEHDIVYDCEVSLLATLYAIPVKKVRADLRKVNHALTNLVNVNY